MAIFEGTNLEKRSTAIYTRLLQNPRVDPENHRGQPTAIFQQLKSSVIQVNKIQGAPRHLGALLVFVIIF